MCTCICWSSALKTRHTLPGFLVDFSGEAAQEESKSQLLVAMVVSLGVYCWCTGSHNSVPHFDHRFVAAAARWPGAPDAARDCVVWGDGDSRYRNHRRISHRIRHSVRTLELSRHRESILASENLLPRSRAQEFRWVRRA